MLAVKAKLSNVAASRAKGTNTFAVAVVVNIMAEFCGAYTLVENNNMRDFAGLALASKALNKGFFQVSNVFHVDFRCAG